MKTKLHFVLALIPLLLLSHFVAAQTTLVVGDIAIFQNQSDTPDDFAFVTFVDIDAGTGIYFTDCGTTTAMDGFNMPTCTEGAVKYVVPVAGLSAGDIIRWSLNSGDFFSYTDTRITGGLSLASTGDQVIAFQDASSATGGTDAGNNPTFLFIIHNASTQFAGDPSDTNETNLPFGLLDTGLPRTAVGVGAGAGVDVEWDNTVYSGSYDFSSYTTIVEALTAAKIALTNPANYSKVNAIIDPTYTADVNAIPTKLTLPPTISFAASSSNGLESVVSANLAVNLSAPSAFTITVAYTISGSASGGGSDYTLSNGTLSLSPGAMSKNIIASIVDDMILEQNETIIVTLSSPTNAILGTNTIHTYTITDNDSAEVTIADISGNENDGVITVTATLDKAVQGGFTVDVSTSDGSATLADSDYSPIVSQTLTFTGNAGETETFTVTPTEDTVVETDETILISQSNLAATTLSVTITDGATVTISNDDVILGVNDTNQLSFEFYPNPTSSMLNISIPIKKVIVYTILGNKIIETNRSSFSVEKLSKGMYLMKVQTEKGTATRKFIKN